MLPDLRRYASFFGLYRIHSGNYRIANQQKTPCVMQGVVGAIQDNKPSHEVFGIDDFAARLGPYFEDFL